MKRPWQVWSVLAGLLAIVLPAMLWLSYLVLKVDSDERWARERADRERNVGTALWRMDAELARLLSPEIARPVSFYRPLTEAPLTQDPLTQDPLTEDPRSRRFSPLLWQPSEFVLLHFEVDAEDVWHSPQVPPQDVAEMARDAGVEAEWLRRAQERLRYLGEHFRRSDLLSELPTQKLLTPRAIAQANHQADASNVSQILENGRWVPQALRPPSADQSSAGQSPADRAQAARANSQAAYGGAPQAVGPSSSSRIGQEQLRQSNDLQQRNTNFQVTAQQQLVAQRPSWTMEPADWLPVEGMSVPLWLKDRGRWNLLLARQVDYRNQQVIQGCWIDWKRLRKHLTSLVEDLLPDAELQPLNPSATPPMNRVLAGLPVELRLPDPGVRSHQPWTPVGWSLAIAWSCLLLAAVACATLIRGVLRLSERRASFVSAVTHELRTPLTTFRMYAEMLAEDMVEPDARHEYLACLQREADRLYHLVENVLQYARLERGTVRRVATQLSVQELIATCAPRLQERVKQAEMIWQCRVAPDVENRMLQTNPSAVEQVLFNLVDNACKYARSATDRRIQLDVHSAGEQGVRLIVRDHGPGVDWSVRKQLFQPFSKSAEQAAASAPGVGLGLALCRRLAEELGGTLTLEQPPLEATGASFELRLKGRMEERMKDGRKDEGWKKG